MKQPHINYRIYWKQRNKEIFKLRMHGRTYNSIGNEFGITTERVRQIVFRAERRYRYMFAAYKAALDNSQYLYGMSVFMGPGSYEHDIENCYFSARTYNALYRTGIRTLGCLLEYTEEYLRNLRNFGEISMNEVREFLDKRGLKLKDSDPFDHTLYRLFTVQVCNCFRKAGIYTLTDLLNETEEDLLSIRNFGSGCMDEVRHFLHKNNLKLRESNSDSNDRLPYHKLKLTEFCDERKNK